ncbi:MAG: hypothetical protein ACMXYE_03675 [Candidatus Woesearchaeota archaeon]
MQRNLEDELNGILFLHSETGTEGGYWAFQDERYIQKSVPRGYCEKCGLYLRDQDGALRIERVTALDAELLKELSETNEVPEKPICFPGTHQEAIGDVWSYDGLHVLKTGDFLTIRDPETYQEIWTGVVNLTQYPLFTESASGMWIHSDQKGIKREEWADYFFKQFPATLYPAKEYFNG